MKFNEMYIFSSHVQMCGETSSLHHDELSREKEKVGSFQTMYDNSHIRATE